MMPGDGGVVEIAILDFVRHQKGLLCSIDKKEN